MFSVYVLQSERGERYYIGSAEDVAQRLEHHNGSGAGWTKRFQPWRVAYVEEHATRGEAVRRERQLKRLKGIAAHLDDLRRGEL